MPNYCVNRNIDSQFRNHEVHRLDQHIRPDGSYDYCPKLPNVENQIPLGFHWGCHTAVAQAKREHYENSDGCAFCSPECNTG